MIESLPTGNFEVASEATPPDSVAVPSTVLPFLNVTVPAGVAPDVALTVAVNVTACPETAGFSEDFTAVVVGISTACASTAEALPASNPAPS